MQKPKQIWMVRAGRGAVCIDDFVDGEFVAIGWDIADDFGKKPEKHEIEERLRSVYSDESDGTISVWASQIVRYFNELSKGDMVATYDPNNRLYYIGKILTDVIVHDHDLKWKRDVQWKYQVSRDSLQTATRNSLGSISTLFAIRDEAVDDLAAHQVTFGADTGSEMDLDKTSVIPKPDLSTRELLNEAINKSAEYIEDKISALNWEQMQELVAEILRAMGYRTRTSGRGADRGVDVFASPDGLGLEEPRIFVEVKHRRGTQIGSQDVRSFLGGRQQGDRCLYVSTGGFTKDARYEAERSNIPLTLITLPQLRELLVEYYETMNATGAALVPLERIYWPA